MQRKKVVVRPLTWRVLRVLFWADRPLTRAMLVARTKAHAATEITRPVRDWRKHGLEVPCVKDAAGRPAYMLTQRDRALIVRKHAQVVRRAA
jgi:hypothetical protein